MKSLFCSHVSKFSILMTICSLSVTTITFPVTAIPQEIRRNETIRTASCKELSLFNTGMDSDGTPLADGESDPHYVLTSVPPGSTVQTRVRRDGKGWPLPPDGPYTSENGISLWIGSDNSANIFGPPGNYTYETTFNISGKQITAIEGRWGADDYGTEILLNNKRVSRVNTSDQYRSFVPFRITNGFRQGKNTLKFVVHNNGSSDNSTGLRVELKCY